MGIPYESLALTRSPNLSWVFIYSWTIESKRSYRISIPDRWRSHNCECNTKTILHMHHYVADLKTTTTTTATIIIVKSSTINSICCSCCFACRAVLSLSFSHGRESICLLSMRQTVKMGFWMMYTSSIHYSSFIFNQKKLFPFVSSSAFAGSLCLRTNVSNFAFGKHTHTNTHATD